MFEQFCYLIALTAIVVVVHALWSVCLIRFVRAAGVRTGSGMLIQLMQIIISMLLVHACEAGIFAGFYVLKSGFSDIETSLYFSIVSYATIGYGDVVLPQSLRLVGAAEGLVGTLLFGWTVALLVKYLQHTKVYGD